MHLVAVSWLMASLTASAALVALVQTAQSLPTLALAVPGGALADVVDRRRMVIATQAWQVAVAAGLGAVTLADAATPGLLLAFTVALGVGTALGLPVFWSVTAEIVPRSELPAAISLNAAAFTLAQAVGPTLGGLLVASIGAGAVFLLNAASFLGVVTLFVAWRRPARVAVLPPEHVVAAVRTGVRYLLNAPPLQVVLVRVLLHALCFSALPALLVVAAKTRLDLGAAGYGALYGCFGAGGAAGALLLPWLRLHLPADRVVAAGSVAFAGPLLALATLEAPAPLYPLMVLAGVGSMTVIASLNVAAQSVLPEWVRGRGLALYIFTFQSGMAAGAALWGVVAGGAGVSTALALAAGCMLAGHLLGAAAGLRLAAADRVDPSTARWVEPELALEPDLGDGPVRVEIEYRIAEADSGEFLAAMGSLRRTRKRDGAMQWSLFQDLTDPERHVETFVVASWAEHERAHERGVRSDRELVERVLALHRGEAPRVTHLLGRRPRSGRGER